MLINKPIRTKQLKNLFNLYLDYRRSHKRHVLRILFTLIMVLPCLFLFVIFNEQLVSIKMLTNSTLLNFVDKFIIINNILFMKQLNNKITDYVDNIHQELEQVDHKLENGADTADQISNSYNKPKYMMQKKIEFNIYEILYCM